MASLDDLRQWVTEFDQTFVREGPAVNMTRVPPWYQHHRLLIVLITGIRLPAVFPESLHEQATVYGVCFTARLRVEQLLQRETQ